MFDALSDKLQATLGDVRQRGALTEDDVKATMREIRLALLEADVNFAVVREFTSAVREEALGEEVLERVDPGQQVVKIVPDELTELMGGAGADLALSPRKPTIVVLAGLQGSGKTTAAAKLARMLREEKGLDVALAACDVYRPAAVEQLVTVGQRAGATVYERGTDMDPVEIAKWARDQAVADGRTCSSSTPPAACTWTGAHAGAGEHQEGAQAPRRAAGRRRHDRPGRGQRGRAVRRAGRLRRRDHEQARR